MGIFADTNNGISRPTGIEFDSTGCLYVANATDSTVRKFTFPKKDLGTIITETNAGFRDIAIDGQNLLYIACANLNQVRRYTTSGEDRGVFASTGLSSPTGLTFDGAGNLYVCNYSAGTVRKISAAGVDQGDIITGLPQPVGIAFDSSGNLIVSMDWASRVAKYTSSGTYVQDLIPPGKKGRFIGLTTDSQGGIFVAGCGTSTIYRIRDGGLVSFGTSGNSPNYMAFGPAKTFSQ
jgi:sugar lactone lactonase YvrE